MLPKSGRWVEDELQRGGEEDDLLALRTPLSEKIYPQLSIPRKEKPVSVIYDLSDPGALTVRLLLSGGKLILS